MKALIFGQTGQVARELRRTCPDDVTPVFLDRAQADLSDPDSCTAAIGRTDCNIVINAAAYTAVDRAEDEEPLATIINGDAPTAMARAAAKKGVPFLHISTDYVFDGSGTRPWEPGDTVSPLGAYGRSKLAGEIGVQTAGGTHAILRTSWVFSAHGANFVKTMLRLAETRDQLGIVSDQIGGPTAAADIATALWQMATAFQAGKGQGGIYHFAGVPLVSWADFAKEIFRQSGARVTVRDILTKDYPTPAARPLNSRMNCADLTPVFGISPPDWRISLTNVLKELGDE